MEYIQTYQQFQQLLTDCQQALTVAAIDRATISKTVQTLGEYFRTQILTAAIAPDRHHYSIQVEINKQLRLLKTDCLFLQSAQQAAKRDQRLQQMTDRLTLLQRYCEMILA